jgi:hypothetical protein
VLALLVSSLFDNYKLNRNFWKQKKGRTEMKARDCPIDNSTSFDTSFQSDSKYYTTNFPSNSSYNMKETRRSNLTFKTPFLCKPKAFPKDHFT